MQELSGLIGDYYGLDWATLFIGLCGSYLVTGGNLRAGFACNIIACVAAFCVACMSHQNGFVVYNVLLVALNMRGILRGDRRKTAAENTLMPEAVPASVPAR